MQIGIKAKVFLIVGALLAVTFLALGIREFMRSEPVKVAQITARPTENLAVLARAIGPIEVGQTITPAMVANAAFDPVRNPAIATPAEIIGKVAGRPIPAGALISRNWVELESKLAIRVPLGRRAISIDTNAEIAVAGLIRPGDMLDVQVVYPGIDALSGARSERSSRTDTILENIQVLAVGGAVIGVSDQDGTAGSSPPPARTVTLALTPEEVATLALAKSTGALSLSLRNPLDTQLVNSPAIATKNAVVRQPRAVPSRRTTSARASSSSRNSRPQSRPAHQIELVIGERQETITSENSR